MDNFGLILLRLRMLNIHLSRLNLNFCFKFLTSEIVFIFDPLRDAFTGCTCLDSFERRVNKLKNILLACNDFFKLSDLQHKIKNTFESAKEESSAA